jgi:ATP synthase protein I
MPDQPHRGGDLRSVSALASAGWAFALSILIGLGAGYLLDRWLGTTPWLFFAGLVLGFAAAVTNLFRAAAAASKPEPPDDTR